MFVRIFDFDRTITIKHTAAEFNISRFKGANAYEQGKKHAKVNTKIGINNFFKHDDHQNISAIATWHDNPDFVAGYVAHILGKELVLDKPLRANTWAVHRYVVDEIRIPLFISFMPSENNKSIFSDSNKNVQLTALREILLKENLITEATIMDFYDDDSNNSNAAVVLDFIKSHTVQIEQEFNYELCERRKSKRTLSNTTNFLNFNKASVPSIEQKEEEKTITHTNKM